MGLILEARRHFDVFFSGSQGHCMMRLSAWSNRPDLIRSGDDKSI